MGTGLPEGRYYVIVDAYSGSGPFTLEIELQ
jgi:tRNA G37 N-methylase Trm5